MFQDLGLDVLQYAFDGYDACLFAYGQTGTGKTFTMMGTNENPGLTPRICEVLFSRVFDETMANNGDDQKAVTYKVEASYYEIYNERVRDLLRTASGKERFSLKVREHPKIGPFVEDLSTFVVRDVNEIRKLIERGNQRRITAATHMHALSSRSHAIFQIKFSQASIVDGLPSEIVSRVHLVDLAGSERASPHEVYTKERMKEGSNINRSLITLGNVINALGKVLFYLFSCLFVYLNGPIFFIPVLQLREVLYRIIVRQKSTLWPLLRLVQAIYHHPPASHPLDRILYLIEILFSPGSYEVPLVVLLKP